MRKKIKVFEQSNDAQGNMRIIEFHDETGKESEFMEILISKVHHEPIMADSPMKIYDSSMSPSTLQKEINIPNGHVIIGMALELDPKGVITWIDFKTCPAW